MSIGVDNSDTGTQAKTGADTVGQGGEPQDAANAPANADNAEEQNYLSTFSDREAAEKGYKELQSHSTKANQENAILRGELEQLKMNQKLAEMDKTLQATQRGRDSETE
jgi:hypothetical protein